MRAMRVERADPALLVTEQDDLLAEELLLARQIFQLLGEAHRLPITAQEFAHRAARLDAGQLIIGWRGLPSISRFHRLPLPGRNEPAVRMQTPPAGGCQRLSPSVVGGGITFSITITSRICAACRSSADSPPPRTSRP